MILKENELQIVGGGYRHMFGLKVRGQRTRCTGRKGGAVGVAKGGKVMPQKSGAPGAPAAVAAPTAGGAAATSTTATTSTPSTTAEKPATAEKKG